MITITKPDDWHIHLRQGDALTRTVNDVANRFGRAIVMPNCRPPITTVTEAAQYKKAILNALNCSQSFEPLMTLYLTDQTQKATLIEAKNSGFIHGVKLYPAGATTNSDKGVTNLTAIYPLLETLAEIDLPLLIHGEVTDPSIDVFDKEALFIEKTLTDIVKHFPTLRIVLEHITTLEAVNFIKEAHEKIAATITVHHLLLNRNDMLTGGIRPHYFCLPILKRQKHQTALIEAATSGNPKFFLGSDSAPHASSQKESACGCAGIYTAHAGIELYAQVFDQAGQLNRLEGFASHFGADFYGLARNKQTITLKQEPWKVPESLTFGDDKLVPLFAGKTINWKIT